MTETSPTSSAKLFIEEVNYFLYFRLLFHSFSLYYNIHKNKNERKLKMKLIEVGYTDGSGWKTAKTTKLCKLLKRIFGKNADITKNSIDCYLTHVSGQSEYYDVVKWTNNRSGYFVGKIYIGGCDGDTFPEDFFEEDEEN